MRVFLACVALAFGLPAAASAAPFVICNTGQGFNCTPATLPDGTADFNYTIIGSPPFEFLGNATVVYDDGYPIFPGGWLANDADSKWIGPGDSNLNGSQDSVGNAGVWIYRTTFDLTGYDPLTALITGTWGSDDQTVDIRINGLSTGQMNAGSPPGASFQSLTPFTIATGFMSGINTLDFYVNNDSGPTGLRVDDIAGTADLLEAAPVPEPATLTLFGAGCLAMARLRRRRSTRG